MLHCCWEILSLCINVISAGTSECPYTYWEQPLTSLECNPYPNNQLILNCEVRGPPLMAFDVVVWYWEPINNPQPQILSSTSKYIIITNRPGNVGTNYRSRNSQMRVKQLNDSNAGWYYCRGNLSNGTLLTPSNKLLLANRSVYSSDDFNPSTCPDRAQTTREPSCASITTDDSLTIGTQSPDLATDSNGGLISPPANTYSPSLPTTVTLAPTPTATPTPESSMFRVALYAVISVIVVFCAVIVTLAVTIVILYRRKGGHTNFKKTAG